MKILIFPGFETHSSRVYCRLWHRVCKSSRLLWDFPWFLRNSKSRKFNDTPKLHENFTGFHFTREANLKAGKKYFTTLFT